MRRPDPSFLAAWSRWWPARPDDKHEAGIRCLSCRTVGYGTHTALGGVGWHSDRAGSWLCPGCAERLRRGAA